jgi:hypothetical protein
MDGWIGLLWLMKYKQWKQEIILYWAWINYTDLRETDLKIYSYSSPLHLLMLLARWPGTLYLLVPTFGYSDLRGVIKRESFHSPIHGRDYGIMCYIQIFTRPSGPGIRYVKVDRRRGIISSVISKRTSLEPAFEFKSIRIRTRGYLRAKELPARKSLPYRKNKYLRKDTLDEGCMDSRVWRTGKASCPMRRTREGN